MNTNNVIQMNPIISVGEFFLQLHVPRGVFDKMVADTLAALPAALEENQHCDFMSHYGEFDPKRIVTMMDNADSAEQIAFILAGVINANGDRPRVIRMVMHTLMDERDVDEADVVGGMYILQQYYQTRGLKFL